MDQKQPDDYFLPNTPADDWYHYSQPDAAEAKLYSSEGGDSENRSKPQQSQVEKKKESWWARPQTFFAHYTLDILCFYH